MIRLFCDVCNEEVKNGNRMDQHRSRNGDGNYEFEGSAIIKGKKLLFRAEIVAEEPIHVCKHCAVQAINERDVSATIPAVLDTANG